MARRKVLRGIVSGLYGSFISRNNDVSGFWGIGKLCLFAQQQGAKTVRIDLLAESISPANTEFANLVIGYGAILQTRLSKADIPKSWVSSAIIELDFSPEQPSGKLIPMITWGKLFKLAVAITDDKMSCHVTSGYGYCGPHNPRKEHQSGGQPRF